MVPGFWWSQACCMSSSVNSMSSPVLGLKQYQPVEPAPSWSRALALAPCCRWHSCGTLSEWGSAVGVGDVAADARAATGWPAVGPVAAQPLAIAAIMAASAKAHAGMMARPRLADRLRMCMRTCLWSRVGARAYSWTIAGVWVWRHGLNNQTDPDWRRYIRPDCAMVLVVCR